jgi:hypothetical protein
MHRGPDARRVVMTFPIMTFVCIQVVREMSVVVRLKVVNVGGSQIDERLCRTAERPAIRWLRQSSIDDAAVVAHGAEKRYVCSAMVVLGWSDLSIPRTYGNKSPGEARLDELG